MAKNKDKKLLLHIENLKQYFPVKKGSMFQKEQLYVKANDGITLDIFEGETVGLVGESGCGKSTFGRSLLQLYHQTDGRSIYYGRDIDEIAPKYVEDILKNLVDKKQQQTDLQKKAEEVQTEYDKLPEKEKLYHIDKLRLAKKQARDAFLDIVQLIGGFYVCSDLSKVSEILLKEYHAAVLLHKQKEELKKYEGAANKEKAALVKQQIAETEKQLTQIRKDIYSMQEQEKKNPKFAEYEVYRDKGVNLAKLEVEEIRQLRKDLQLIFQDPYSSLNPRMTVGQIIGEGLLSHNYYSKNNDEMEKYILNIMERCGLAPYFINRYPHQFSGGQRQRIGIARSLALKPKFVVCDEAVSALDVSIQSQVINLLLDLKEEEGLTYLFISHDLSVIKYISDRVGVMYLGNLVELAETQELFDHPMHPYTEALLSAIPTTDLDDTKERILLEGDIPSPIHPPTGCKFNTRCRYCTEECKIAQPEWREIRPGHFVACHHVLEKGQE